MAPRPRGEVHEVDRFGARHDELWARVARDMECAVVRDASYLNWKYVEQPGQDFLRLEVVEGETARGVAVLAFHEPDGKYAYRRASLVELVAPPSDDRSLRETIAVASRAAAGRGADSLVCLHIGARLTAALRRSGFLIREPGRFLLVSPGDLEGEARRRVLSAEGWFATQGDSDIDRPW